MDDPGGLYDLMSGSVLNIALTCTELGNLNTASRVYCITYQGHTVSLHIVHLTMHCTSHGSAGCRGRFCHGLT